jgi:predicted O-methyltransferase YrrM
MDLPIDMDTVKGFMAADEAQALYDSALAVAGLGPILEIGSYCGKSTIYLGLACQLTGNTVFALDHHRGSEEHQKGEFFHDPDLYDVDGEQMDTFIEFRYNMDRAGINDVVVPVVASSGTASRHWQTPLGMVFIDGGHSLDAAVTDYRCWAGHLVRGGTLAIHDVFPNPADGGHAPYTIARLALASGLFEEISQVNSLALLRRV